MKKWMYAWPLVGILLLTGCNTTNSPTEIPTPTPTPTVFAPAETPLASDFVSPSTDEPSVQNAVEQISGLFDHLWADRFTLLYVDSNDEEDAVTFSSEQYYAVRGLLQQYEWRHATPSDFPEELTVAAAFTNTKETLSICKDVPVIRTSNGGTAEFYMYSLPDDSAWQALDVELLAMLESNVPFLPQYVMREIFAGDTTFSYTNVSGEIFTMEPSDTVFEQIHKLFEQYDWLLVPSYYDPPIETHDFFVVKPGNNEEVHASITVCVGVQMIVASGVDTSFQYLYYIPEDSTLQPLDVELLAIFE